MQPVSPNIVVTLPANERTGHTTAPNMHVEDIDFNNFFHENGDGQVPLTSAQNDDSRATPETPDVDGDATESQASAVDAPGLPTVHDTTLNVDARAETGQLWPDHTPPKLDLAKNSPETDMLPAAPLLASRQSLPQSDPDRMAVPTVVKPSPTRQDSPPLMAIKAAIAQSQQLRVAQQHTADATRATLAMQQPLIVAQDAPAHPIPVRQETGNPPLTDTRSTQGSATVLPPDPTLAKAQVGGPTIGRSGQGSNPSPAAQQASHDSVLRMEPATRVNAMADDSAPEAPVATGTGQTRPLVKHEPPRKAAASRGAGHMGQTTAAQVRPPIQHDAQSTGDKGHRDFATTQEPPQAPRPITRTVPHLATNPPIAQPQTVVVDTSFDLTTAPTAKMLASESAVRTTENGHPALPKEQVQAPAATPTAVGAQPPVQQAARTTTLPDFAHPLAQPRNRLLIQQTADRIAKDHVTTRPDVTTITTQMLPQISPQHLPVRSLPTTAPIATDPQTGETAIGLDVLKQMSRAAPHAPDAPIEIVLKPADLGRVKLVLTLTDAVPALHISTDRPETLDLIRRHIDVLVQEYRSQGYHGMTVTLGGDQQTGFAAGQNGHRNDQTKGRRDTETASLPDVAAPPEAALRLRQEHLDIRL